MTYSKFCLPVLLSSLFIFITLDASPVSAQSRWIDEAGGFWEIPSNWQGGLVPSRSVTATFDLDATYNVNWDSLTGDTVSGDIFVTNGDVTFQGIGSLRTHTLDEDGDARLNISNSTLNIGDDINGAFNLDVGDDVRVLGGGTLNVGHGSRLITLGTGVTQHGISVSSSLDEEALMELSSGAFASTDYVTLYGFGEGGTGRFIVDGSGTLLNVDRTLGVGNFTGGHGELLIRSGGAVDANFTRIGNSKTGSGSLDVSGSGSALNTTRLYVGVDDPTGIADSHRLVIRSGAVVTTGISSQIAESGEVQMAGGRFEFGAMNIQHFDRVSGSSGSMAGTTSNSAYRDVATLTGLRDRGLDLSDVEVTNLGTFHGSASFGNFSIDNTASGEIQTFSGEQMRFAGSGINSGEINNFGGLIRFDGSLTNDSDGFMGGRGVVIANGGITNQGVMAFSGTTDLLGDIVMAGDSQLVTSGIGTTTTIFDDIVHNGSEIRTSAGSATVILGEASGAGDYTGTGTVFFEGDLRPGNSPDIVSFEGDVVLGFSAVTFLELGGDLLGQFDQLDVDGDFDVNGDLFVGLIDGFELQADQQFLIADVGGLLTGQFSGLNEGDLVGNFSGHNLFITYDGFDGNSGVGLFTSAVPEPGSGLLLAFAMVACLSRRNRKPNLQT